MTRQELDIWLVEMGRLFPEVTEWLGARGADLGFVLDSWAGAMSEVSLEQARKVTKRILAGELPRLDRWSLSGLPAVVISNAPKSLPTLAELNDPKTGWTGNGGYRGK